MPLERRILFTARTEGGSSRMLNLNGSTDTG
jgi:hypothetical protein